MSKELHDAICIAGAQAIGLMLFAGVIFCVLPWIWRKTGLQRYFIAERIRCELALIRIRRYEKACMRMKCLERRYRNALRYLDSRPWRWGVR